jgi:pyrroline-5-carboxylate reductase
MDKKITIIGGGNLGIAITEGLIRNNFINPFNITVTRRRTSLLSGLVEKGVSVIQDNRKAIADADIILLAIKPFQIQEVLKDLVPVLKNDRQMIISVVTGFSLDEITSIVGEKITVFRAMPNTAIAIGESMTCIATKNGGEKETETVIKIFNQLGKAIQINEELMEAATVLGACGIAFSLRFIRAATQGGIEIGFDAKTAELIASQTVKGAASLILKEGNHPEREIDKVTTPQGCTIVGLNEMEHQGFSSSLIRGILASFNKIARFP